MAAELTRAVIFFFLLILLTLILTLIAGEKLKTVTGATATGARKELYVLPGWISVTTFLVVAALSWYFLTFVEARTAIEAFFNKKSHDDTFPLAVALVMPVVVALFDFIFVAYLTPKLNDRQGSVMDGYPPSPDSDEEQRITKINWR